jgi:transcriptional antiterminator RfaH
MGLIGRRRNWWTVLATKSQSGSDAARRVLDQGFECYRPRYRAAPHRGVRRVAPLFPGYIFARVSRDNWKPLASTRDVSRVFMAGEYPVCLSDEVEQIRSLENHHGYVEPDFAQPPRFERGESVEARTGIFKDKFGIYDGLIDGSGGRRVRVLFEFLGGRIRHEISAFDLSRAAA